VCDRGRFKPGKKERGFCYCWLGINAGFINVHIKQDEFPTTSTITQYFRDSASLQARSKKTEPVYSSQRFLCISLFKYRIKYQIIH